MVVSLLKKLAHIYIYIYIYIYIHVERNSYMNIYIYIHIEIKNNVHINIRGKMSSSKNDVKCVMFLTTIQP